MTTTVSLSKQDLIAGIIETLSICGGVVPADEMTFWKEAAAWAGIAKPASALPGLAQQVIERLGATWEDDFIDDDGELSIAVYETLDEAAKKAHAGGVGGDGAEEEEEDGTPLQDIPAANVQITTTNWATVMNLIKSNTLMLSPEWQRNFVWKAKKQKGLIESILLGLPVPSFLVYSNSKTGQKYVIDGRQRLETLSRFCSAKEKKGEPRVRFKTFSKNQPNWGEKQPLEKAANKYFEQLDAVFQRKILDAKLVMAEFRDIGLTDLYQVFKRYNSGAVALNAAEIRNAVYQASPLHKMMFRLGGEQRPKQQYLDAEEQQISIDLRETLGQQRRQRYGTYDFIGRYFAFAYQSGGSVAQATLAFMDNKEFQETDRIEQLRKEFIRVFKSAGSWYQSFLVDPDESRINVFLGTLQLVSTKIMLEHIEAGRCAPEQVKAEIAKSWPSFARNRLRLKQNSTLFWGSQKTWVTMLELALGLAPEIRRYPTWTQADIDRDLAAGAEDNTAS